MPVMQLPAFQPPQLESPGNMMARMAQVQALQDASEEKQLALAQRRKLQGEQEELNALVNKEGGLTQNVLTRMATMLDPKAREIGFAGLQDLADREAFFNAGPKPNQFAPEPAPARPSLLNRLMPQEQTSTPLPTGAPVNNVLGRSRSFNDPVLEGLYNQRDVTVARLQMARGDSKWADKAKTELASLDKQIDNRLKFYDPATVAEGATRYNPLLGDKRTPTTFEQLVEGSGIVPGSDEFKDALAAKVNRESTHPPTYVVGPTGVVTAVTPPRKAGEAPKSQPVAGGKEIGRMSPEEAKARRETAEITRQIDLTLPQLREIIKPKGLLDQATSGGIGAVVDATVGLTGASLPGAVATAKLQPIADLVLKMVPRFEGPQSNADTISYNKAAGDLANPYKPREERRAAAKVIIEIMTRRRDQFGFKDQPAAPAAPAADSGTTVTQPSGGGGGQWRVHE